MAKIMSMKAWRKKKKINENNMNESENNQWRK
jgi:hypothetical protein